MKLKFTRTSKIFLSASAILCAVLPTSSFAEDQPCAVVMKSGKGVQVIPPQGKVQTRFQVDNPLACESMLITQQEAFWVRLADQTMIKLAPHSFLEISKPNSNVYRIYRGSALISAPPGIHTQTWSTPNSESVFKGGVAFIQYSANEKLTTVGCFNRNFEFKNKFNGDASQVVHAGETSSLMIQDAQVTPTQPAVMSHHSVVSSLANLGLPETDHAELVTIVKKIYQERAKALASEIEEWEEVPETVSPTRALASVKVPKAQKALDPKEANFVNAQIRAHLYGSDEDQKALDTGRKPASIKGSLGLKDSEKVKQEKELQRETKKLEKEIEHLNTEN